MAGSERVAVISGPAGVGKGTVVSALRRRRPDITVSVSATTRAPRPGEVDGRHYHFVTEERFDDLIATDGLLEWATVHGRARYGTPREPVMAALARGETVILEIDLQGARQVRRTLPGATFVFLEPPSWEELTRRLVGRGTETEAEQRRRLETARVELAARDDFDVVVTNVDVERSVDELLVLLGLGA